LPPPLEGYFDTSPNGQFALACRYDKGNKTVGFGLDSILSKSSYLINDTFNKNVRVVINDFNKPFDCQFNGSTYPFLSISGEVELSRKDIINGIFSGTFQFTLKTRDCGNYEVTNGRFDYKF